MTLTCKIGLFAIDNGWSLTKIFILFINRTFTFNIRFIVSEAALARLKNKRITKTTSFECFVLLNKDEVLLKLHKVNSYIMLISVSSLFLPRKDQLEAAKLCDNALRLV